VHSAWNIVVSLGAFGLEHRGQLLGAHPRSLRHFDQRLGRAHRRLFQSLRRQVRAHFGENCGIMFGNFRKVRLFHAGYSLQLFVSQLVTPLRAANLPHWRGSKRI
jgi:hypothetical protein